MSAPNNSSLPNISVAMATCNGGAFVEAQIESVLVQELPPVELIVCDDSSTDGTIDILRRYEEKGVLRLVVNEQRLGVINNFRKAVSLCDRANYIALCDQDDYWLPEKLKENFKALYGVDDNTRPAMAYSDLQPVNEKLEPLASSFWQVLGVDPSHETISSLVYGNFISGCTIMMNGAMAKLFCQMPNDSRVVMHDAWLGLIAYTFGTFAYTPKPLLLYRQHGGNATFETNQKKDLALRLRQSLAQLTKNDAYLRTEIDQAILFRDTFEHELGADHLNAIDLFIRLGNASFFRKKMSSMLARKYRFIPTKKRG